MKVVIEIATGKPVYQQLPDFEEGKGIANAVAIFGGVPEDYREVEITEEQYNSNPAIVAQRVKAENEAKITAKMRELAVTALIEAGELTGVAADYTKTKETP